MTKYDADADDANPAQRRNMALLHAKKKKNAHGKFPGRAEREKAMRGAAKMKGARPNPFSKGGLPVKRAPGY